MDLKRWKILKNFLISALVAYCAVKMGADPTITVAIIALINNVSIVDLTALWGTSINISLHPNKPMINVSQDRRKERVNIADDDKSDVGQDDLRSLNRNRQQ